MKTDNQREASGEPTSLSAEDNAISPLVHGEILAPREWLNSRKRWYYFDKITENDQRLSVMTRQSLVECLAAYSAHQSAQPTEQERELRRSLERERAEVSARNNEITRLQRARVADSEIIGREKCRADNNAIEAQEHLLARQSAEASLATAQQENAKLRALVGLDKYPKFESMLEVGQALIDKNAEIEKLRKALPTIVRKTDGLWARFDIHPRIAAIRLDDHGPIVNEALADWANLVESALQPVPKEEV